MHAEIPSLPSLCASSSIVERVPHRSKVKVPLIICLSHLRFPPRPPPGCRAGKDSAGEKQGAGGLPAADVHH